MKKNSNFYGEHFEALGDIWDAVSGNVKDFLSTYFVKSLEKGSLYWTQKIDDKLIYSLIYPGKKKRNKYIRIGELLKKGNEHIQIMHYVEDDKTSKTHITTCPVLRGVKNTVKLLEAYTWENQVEGEFSAKSLSVNNLVLNFFDPFYCFDKKYNFKKDKECTVYLSAIAYYAEELEERDYTFTEGSYYDACLEGFLKENPNKTESDFEPPIVEMRAEHFRMYAPKDITSVIEIVGLIEDVEYFEELGRKFAVLKVNLEHREDNEYLYVNVYVGENLLDKYTPEVGKGIVANIHLMGYLEHYISKDFCRTLIMTILLILVLILTALGY